MQIDATAHSPDPLMAGDLSPELKRPKEKDKALPDESFEQDDPLENVQGTGNTTSLGGVIISVVLNILLISSFLLEYRVSDANRMNRSVKNEFEDYPISLSPRMYVTDLSRLKEVILFIESVVFDNVMYPARPYIPSNYYNLLNQTVDLEWYKTLQDNLTYQEPTDLSAKEYNTQSMNYFLNSVNLFKGMILTVEYYPDVEFTTPPQTKFFISATMSQREAKNLIGEMEQHIHSNLIQYLNIDTIFYNIITQVALYRQITFSQPTSASFTIVTSVKPFFPKTFDGDSVNLEEQLLILIFRSLFGLSLFFRGVKAIAVDLYRSIKIFFQTKTLILPGVVIFNLILIVLLALLMILSSVISFEQRGTFLPYEPISQEQFETFMGFAEYIDIIIKFLAVCIGVLIIEILLLLNTQFPTFGILFHTLGTSKGKLMIFGATIFTLLAGFIFVLNLNFGPSDANSSGIGSALIMIFEFMITNVDVDTLRTINPPLAMIFFFVYDMLINMMIILVFIVIIISTYVQLRKKLQLTTLALAEIAADKSNKLKEKYINLLLFRMPQENTENKGKSKNLDREETYKMSLKNKKEKKDLIEILKYNLEEVDYFGFTNTTRQSRDQIEKEIRAKIKEIRGRKEDKKKQRVENRRKGLFDKFADLVTYLIFIILYTYTLNYQINVESTFEINQTLKNFYENAAFLSDDGYNRTFTDIRTFEDIKYWTRDVYLAALYNNFRDPNQTETSIVDSYGRNFITTTAVSRITVRKLKITNYTDSTGRYEFVVRNSKDLIDSDPYSNTYELAEDIISNDGVLNKVHTGSDNLESMRENGGYVWVFDRDLSNARRNYAEFSHPAIINLNTGLIAYQTVYYSPNFDMIGMCEFIISINPNGDMVKTYHTKGFTVQLYSCDGCKARLAFEIIYLLLVLKQTYDMAKKWLVEWAKVHKLTPVKEEFKEKEIYYRLMNYDFENAKFFSFISALLLRLFQIARRMTIATLEMLKQDYRNIIVSCSLILTYISFGYYFSFLSYEFQYDFKTYRDYAVPIPDISLSEEIGRYERLAELSDQYRLFQAFNSWLIILRILVNYGFSKELSLVLELVYEASFDIIFFLAMLFIILLGFSVDAYFLFGTRIQSLATVFDAFLEVLIIMVSGQPAPDFSVVNGIVNSIYYVVLVCICLLILLKMFLAILDGHFTELTSDSNQMDNLGVFELIVSLVVEKVKTTETNKPKKEYPEGAGKITKLKIDATNKLEDIRSKIIENLRIFMFGEDGGSQNQDTEGREENDKKVTIDIKFKEGHEERNEELKEIKVYLEDEALGTDDRLLGENSEQFEGLHVSSKWMSELEKFVYRISNNQLRFESYGTGAKDILSLECKDDPDMISKMNEKEKTYNFQIERMRQEEIDRKREADIEKKSDEEYENSTPSMPLVDYYVEYVAKPDYTKTSTRGFKNRLFYNKIMEHIEFIFYKSLTATDEANENKIEQSDIEEEEEELERQTTKKLHVSLQRSKRRFRDEGKSPYREGSFEDPNENLLKFWEFLKFKHRYELWAGGKADLMPNSIRHCLWVQMKFNGASFDIYVPKHEFEREGCDVDQIGMKELECLWGYWKNQPEVERKGASATETKGVLNTNHIRIIEQILRGDSTNMILDLRKFETFKEKLNFLKSLKTIKHDPKLILWILMPSEAKINLVLRITNQTLCDFTMMLLLEEIYDNNFVVQTIEKNLHHDMKNRIYMLCLSISNFEASHHGMGINKETHLPVEDPDIEEYIAFLETQLASTTEAKAKCLGQIQRVLKKEDANRSELELSRLSNSDFRHLEKFAAGLPTSEEEGHSLLRKERAAKNASKRKESEDMKILKDESTMRKETLENEDLKNGEDNNARIALKNFKSKEPTKF